MAFFSKKNKKEKKGGFFSKRKYAVQEEAALENKEEAEEVEEKSSAQEHIATGDVEEAISEREQAVRDEKERRRIEAEAEIEKERQEAITLAAEAAKLAALAQDVEEVSEIEETSVDAEDDIYSEESLIISEEELKEEPEDEFEEKSEDISEEELEKESEEEPEEPDESQNEVVETDLDEKSENTEKSGKKSIFDKIREGLRKTKESMMSRIQNVLGSFTKIDEDLFDELLETMIMGDMGVETSEAICDALRKRIKERGITDPSEIMNLIQEIIAEILGEDQSLDLSTKPSIVVVIGVNGAGKTTTIGKLCHQLKDDGKKVIVAAADTFRAAAIDQLEVWTQRSGVELVKHSEGSDPGAVVYDAIDAAKARGCDVLICDTAGRLHNKKNLMQELAKINRIISNRAEGCSVETLLVLDATTGQNAVNQARLFKEVSDISGIVLTKLDGTAKGGIIVSIKNELDIPVKLIGVGEKIDDLQPFHASDFVNALFEKEEHI
mgnify:CR=1 FL=1